jgi:predicted dehydrogenase
MKKDTLSVLVVGFGRMGKRHAAAYQSMGNYELVGICGRDHQQSFAESEFPDAAFYLEAEDAIATAKADVVCIATHIDSHDGLSRAAIDNGAHVFLEKPVAETLAETEALFAYANGHGRKVVVGYVRKHDPLWKSFVEKGGQLGSPVVVRFVLDQPSAGDGWQVHQSILKNSSLTFDCAVHYADMMSKISGAEPVRVTGKAVRLHGDPTLNGNYGFLNVEFSDGSVGSFDSAWGPMVGAKTSSVVTATGPQGSVSIVSVPASADDGTVPGEALIFEPSMKNDNEQRAAEVLRKENSADGDRGDAYVLQQQYLYDCIANDACMDEHFKDVLTSMIIVAAADESAATGKTVSIGSTAQP